MSSSASPEGALPADPDADPGGALPHAEPALDNAAYGRGARILGVGIASTGLFTFAYLALASHALTKAEYGAVSTLWAVLFTAMSVAYRPVEQLLSRTVATARARGEGTPPLAQPLRLQAGFALAFLVLALALKGVLVERFGGSEALFWIFVAASVAYAASYFARGYVAGRQWFGLYGGLVLFESLARVLFPVAVLLGLLTGQTVVALGVLAAPLASLLVVPWAILGSERRAGRGAATAESGAGGGATAAAGDDGPADPAPAAGPPPRPAPGKAVAGGGFALAVAAVQLGEQVLVNAGIVLAGGTVAAAVVANVILISRAPLQLFQAIQTSLLPHLSALDATSGREAFAAAIRTTALAIAGFAAITALGLLLVGPFVMKLAFGADYAYDRLPLVIIAVGMGLHLVAGTLNQAALARGQSGWAAGAWLLAAGLFVAWLLAVPIGDEVLRTVVGYALAAGLLCLALWAVYRRPPRTSAAPA